MAPSLKALFWMVNSRLEKEFLYNISIYIILLQYLYNAASFCINNLFAVSNKEFMIFFRTNTFSSIVLLKRFSEKAKTDFLIKWLTMATSCLFTLLFHPSIPSNTTRKWNLTKKLFSRSLRCHAYDLYHVSRDHAFVVSHLIYKCR